MDGYSIELTAFIDELRRVATGLGGPTPDGPCDDPCGCTTDPSPSTDVSVIANPASVAVPIACTLDAEQAGDQVARWRELLATATTRDDVPHGVRFRFARSAEVTAIADLVAAEQDCCRFFTFTLGIDHDAVTLTATAPPDARPMLDELFGTGM
jgi:hypothetical protein